MQTERYFKMWTDGGARGNPGPSGIGVKLVEQLPEDTVKIVEISEYIGAVTNNQAEYRALVRGLEWLAQYAETNGENIGSYSLEVYTDSELMAYQIQGRYKVKNAELRPVYDKAVKLLNIYKVYTITPIPRQKNQEADRLVNQAIDAAVAGVSHV